MNMPQPTFEIVDMHVHVGLPGDRWPHWGAMSSEYRKSIPFKIFLLFAGVESDLVCDEVLREKTIEIVSDAAVDKVVLLPLDPVYTENGKRSEPQSHFWVSNDYVMELCAEPLLAGKTLPACSIHPYDRDFVRRTKECVSKGAVMMKWLPSAQQIHLAHPKVLEALSFLATAGRDGSALPLLLHIGPEYAIPSTDERTRPYDYLNWTMTDSIVNFFRFSRKWHIPNIRKVHENLRAGLDAGCKIIFAHCGLPYFFEGIAGRLLEHNEFDQVKRYLEASARGEFRGLALADVSAMVTPFRKRYFDDIRELPVDHVLYGSDFPTPAFELSADFDEFLADLRAVLQGDFSRIVVPQDNLLDVNLNELRRAFPGHPLFYNFSRLGLGR